MKLKIGVIGSEGRLGKAIAKMLPIVPVLKGVPRINLDCDVLIDVSSPLALEENLSARLPIVIGTTGHTDFRLIEDASKRLPIFYASNFSLGAVLLNQCAALIQKYFPADIDIVETHHSGKKDAPSGTALQLQKTLPNAKVHSIRSGSTVGEHSIFFNAPEEKLTLTHQAHSREAFAKGAILAAKFIVNQPPGLYTMDNLFS